MVHTTEPQIGTASSNLSCFGPIATTHAQNDKPFRKCPCSERETIVSMHRMHCWEVASRKRKKKKKERQQTNQKKSKNNGKREDRLHVVLTSWRQCLHCGCRCNNVQVPQSPTFPRSSSTSSLQLPPLALELFSLSFTSSLEHLQLHSSRFVNSNPKKESGGFDWRHKNKHKKTNKQKEQQKQRKTRKQRCLV